MLQDSFCSSPWFHIRLSYDGAFELCRWGKSAKTQHNIQTSSIMDFYNSTEMCQLRSDLLAGTKPDVCSVCYYEESFDKLNGRQRQLLKSAVKKDDFALRLKSSPHYDQFVYSQQHHGMANYMPVDLQIDLGNVCNSGCIMCRPDQSSKLASEYHKLNQFEPSLFAKPAAYKSWTQDPQLIDRFVNELAELTELKYIHFLGGETLYDPAFYRICDKLVETGIAANVIVGTTTNGTVFDKRIENYIHKFKQFHLGISIETVTNLNDYVRWPSKISNVLDNISKFNQLRSTGKLYNSLRITPNLFTISHIDSLIEYMIDNEIAAESCNILYRPAHLRIELMPENIRQQSISRLKAIVDAHNLTKKEQINARQMTGIKQSISNVALDYINFLENYQVPSDAELQRQNLVKFLKAFERSRGNSIIDYAPEYTQFLRDHGY